MVLKKEQKGFSLFIAVVVMGALLLVAFAISNLASKEVSFSTYNRDSQYAFFAADAGIECALYWDSKVTPSAFSTTTSGAPISCANNTINNGDPTPPISGIPSAMIGGGGDGNPTSIFYFSLNSGTNPVSSCAIVTVTKNTDGSTHIASKGYNNCVTSDPRRVERGVEVLY